MCLDLSQTSAMVNYNAVHNIKPSRANIGVDRAVKRPTQVCQEILPSHYRVSLNSGCACFGLILEIRMTRTCSAGNPKGRHRSATHLQRTRSGGRTVGKCWSQEVPSMGNWLRHQTSCHSQSPARGSSEVHQGLSPSLSQAPAQVLVQALLQAQQAPSAG